MNINLHSASKSPAEDGLQRRLDELHETEMDRKESAKKRGAKKRGGGQKGDPRGSPTHNHGTTNQTNNPISNFTTPGDSTSALGSQKIVPSPGSLDSVQQNLASTFTPQKVSSPSSVTQAPIVNTGDFPASININTDSQKNDEGEPLLLAANNDTSDVENRIDLTSEANPDEFAPNITDMSIDDNNGNIDEAASASIDGPVENSFSTPNAKNINIDVNTVISTGSPHDPKVGPSVKAATTNITASTSSHPLSQAVQSLHVNETVNHTGSGLERVATFDPHSGGQESTNSKEALVPNGNVDKRKKNMLKASANSEQGSPHIGLLNAMTAGDSTSNNHAADDNCYIRFDDCTDENFRNNMLLNDAARRPGSCSPGSPGRKTVSHIDNSGTNSRFSSRPGSYSRQENLMNGTNIINNRGSERASRLRANNLHALDKSAQYQYGQFRGRRLSAIPSRSRGSSVDSYNPEDNLKNGSDRGSNNNEFEDDQEVLDALEEEKKCCHRCCCACCYSDDDMEDVFPVSSYGNEPHTGMAQTRNTLSSKAFLKGGKHGTSEDEKRSRLSTLKATSSQHGHAATSSQGGSTNFGRNSSANLRDMGLTPKSSELIPTSSMANNNRISETNYSPHNSSVTVLGRFSSHAHSTRGNSNMSKELGLLDGDAVGMDEEVLGLAGSVRFRSKLESNYDFGGESFGGDGSVSESGSQQQQRSSFLRRRQNSNLNNTLGGLPPNMSSDEALNRDVSGGNDHERNSGNRESNPLNSATKRAAKRMVIAKQKMKQDERAKNLEKQERKLNNKMGLLERAQDLGLVKFLRDMFIDSRETRFCILN